MILRYYKLITGGGMKTNKLKALILAFIMMMSLLPISYAETSALTDNTEISVWHDWDFEDTASPSGWVNAGSDDRIIMTHEKYGNGMALTSGKEAKETFTPPQTTNSGVINISYDFIGDDERGNEIFSFNSYGEEDGRKYVFFMTEKNQFKMGKDGLINWGDANKVKDIELNKLYHIDMIFDFDNLKFTSYANGDLIGTSKLSLENNIQNTYWYLNNSYFFDNFRMAKIEEGSYEVQKIHWIGDYLEVLLSEGAGKAEHSLTVNDFTVTDAETGNTVTPSGVEVVGRRIIFSGLDKDKNYEITLPDDFKNFMGTKLSDGIISQGGRKTSNLRLTKDKSGTALTESAKQTLKPGDKVYAELTYRNTTGESESFIVFGASYSGNKLTDVNTKTITSDGKDAKTTTEYIEIDVTDTSDYADFKSVPVNIARTSRCCRR